MKYWEIGSYFRKVKYIEAETLDEVCREYLENFFDKITARYKSYENKDETKLVVSINYEYTIPGVTKPINDKLVCICRELTPEEYVEKKLLK